MEGNELYLNKFNNSLSKYSLLVDYVVFLLLI